jgi:choline dehydrogenase-like flavoprotein
MFASIIEDLPYVDNRVFISDNGDIEFEYNYRDELRVRSLALRKNLSKLVKSKYRIVKLSGKNNINFGHSCGTCCFGLDPTESVLDKNNRSHDISNLFIVDASFFPSSGGANPSLTIAANAIRVAEYIESEWDNF